MFFILSKLLSIFILPVFWISLLLILAIYLKKRRKQLLIAAFIAFYFFSNEFIVMEFMRAWEIKPMHKELKKDLNCDVGIVLGGYAVYDVEYDIIGFHDSADRLLEALRLYQTNHIQKIFLVGGSGNLRDTAYKESIFVRSFLEELGVPSKDIVIDDLSRNTAQNAKYASDYIKNNYKNASSLLITSGFHMRRSLACFSKLDLSPIPYSVDRKAGPRKWDPAHLLLPNMQSMILWHTLLHEWLGVISYQIAGYI